MEWFPVVMEWNNDNKCQHFLTFVVIIQVPGARKHHQVLDNKLMEIFSCRGIDFNFSISQILAIFLTKFAFFQGLENFRQIFNFSSFRDQAISFQVC